MTEPLSIALSASDARQWGEAMVECLRKLPEADPRREVMRGRMDRGLRGNMLFCVVFRGGMSVMAPNDYARGLLIEARSWV